MGGVVSTPRRAGDPTPRKDAPRTVDMEGRRGSRRPLVNGATVRGRPTAARSRQRALAGLSAGRRASSARGMGRAPRSKRSSTRRTSALPLPTRERHTRSNTNLTTTRDHRTPSTTHRTAYLTLWLVKPVIRSDGAQLTQTHTQFPWSCIPSRRSSTSITV
jgi:hypothetical protein